jgi:hypothetical protein
MASILFYHDMANLEVSVYELIIWALVILGLWGGHWMPWRVVPFLADRDGHLRRPFAYAYGCGWIFVGVVLWATFQTGLVVVWDVVCFLGAVIVAAGIGTMAPRGVRWISEHRALEGDVEDYEQALEK